LLEIALKEMVLFMLLITNPSLSTLSFRTDLPSADLRRAETVGREVSESAGKLKG
jgi:hypothetical protein